MNSDHFLVIIDIKIKKSKREEKKEENNIISKVIDVQKKI